ncbi:MAG: rod shape-determining protein RodA [Coriobacteriia bacterium]|nr:rod shape-determining protein RodA [Coriobacteriia bacterium]
MKNDSLLNRLKSTGSAYLHRSKVDPIQNRTRYIFFLYLFSAAIILFGLIIVFSAVQNNEDYEFSRQLICVLIGIVLMIIVSRFDYKVLSNMVIPLIIINIILIMSPHLPFIGVHVKGASSWIRLGIQIQPGEFAKITVILLAASVVSKYGGHLDDSKEYVKTLALLLIPFICIMTQPDLGTGLVYLFIAAIALVAGGARLKYLLITLAVFVILFLIILGIDELTKTINENGEVEYHFLKNYQRERLFIFLNPESDASGSGYNLRQAQIAVGSGGFFGKGLMHGTQAALKFLPEAPTDFIFCVLAEETGFVGVALLLVLYIGLILTSIRIAFSAEDLFGKLLVWCCVGMWVFQIFQNIGMCCGVMPITGIPLPFISYGSSFMIVNCVMLGLIGSVAINGISYKRKRIRYGATR